MQYELQKLERMSLDDVREIARSMGLNPRRSQSVREISYAILDAQADNRAAVVQAKEEARAAAGKAPKRERIRGVQRSAAKVNTANRKSENVVVTVGTEKEQMAKMQADIDANQHHPNRTVQQAGGILGDAPEEVVKTPVEQPKAEEAPQPKAKKRGRPKKVKEDDVKEIPFEAPAPKAEAVEAPKAETPKPEPPKQEEPKEEELPEMMIPD